MLPTYDLDKIKFATDAPTFERAVGLYEGGKVTKFQNIADGFSAVVFGSKFYQVFVSARHYDRGSCTCYLGQEDTTLCKRMVAVAIRAVTGGESLRDEDKRLLSQPVCSGRLGTLSKEELAEIKKLITAAMRYIKSYNGPSRIWFVHQDSLREGCNRLSALVCDLQVSEQTARLPIDMLVRLDDKLFTGGVDDSDGTVGTFMEETVQVFKQCAALDHACIRSFHALENKDTCFGWEAPLLKLIKK